MAIKALNSVAGFSVGETPSNIILANGDITTTNITTTGVSNLNAIGNVKITGGTNGQVIQTDGSGNLSFITISQAGLSNGTSNINVLNNGNITFSSAGNANVVVVSGLGEYVNGVLSVTGNANIGNIGTAGLITATGNITGGNILTGGIVSAVGTVTGGYLYSSGDVSGAGNVTGGNLVTSGLITVTGNANIGNIGTGGLITATGNITGGNLVTAGIVSATGNATAGNISTGGLITATGNITGGNLVTAGVISATGNANVGNLGTSGIITVTGTATVGNLATAGTVSAGGNANVGNLGTSGLITATGNIGGGNINTGGVVSATGNITGGNLVTAGVLNVTGTAQSNISGNLNMNSKNIISLADPVNPQDAATKKYVDEVAQGLDPKASVATATTGTLAAATGGTTSYDNGTSGVGATITTTGSFTTISGIDVTTVGTRILVKNESNAAWNGIYTYTNSTTITRSTDFDIGNEMSSSFVFVEAGTNVADTGWVCIANTPVTVGTTNIVWVQFSGAGTYTAGDGLTLTGTEFSVNTAQPNITSVGTLTSLSISGNANIGNIGTAGIVTATGNITGGNLVTTGTANVGTLAVTGTSNLNAIGNITITGGTSGQVIQTDGAGVLSFVTIDTWRIQNGTSNVAVATLNGNVTTSVAGVANVFVVTSTGANVAGTISASGNANVGNIGTGGLITATGNITGGNIITAGDVQANTANIATSITQGTTVTTVANVTTTSTTPNQTISTFSTSGITGVEWLVKGVDASGAKYSVATVHAVTDGTNVDWAVYGGLFLGATTGSLSVNINAGNIRLAVTPASSNSTVWTTQYRLI